MAAKALRFNVKLDGQKGSSVASLTPPFDVIEAFGTKARVPVRGTINGFAFRSSLMPMGGCHFMVVNKTIRDGANVKAGDVVNVPVGEQHRGRPEPVPPDDLLDSRLSVLARVDDETLRARRRRDQVTVRGEGAGGEPGDQHVPSSAGGGMFRPASSPIPGYRGRGAGRCGPGAGHSFAAVGASNR